MLDNHARPLLYGEGYVPHMYSMILYLPSKSTIIQSYTRTASLLQKTYLLVLSNFRKQVRHVSKYPVLYALVVLHSVVLCYLPGDEGEALEDKLQQSSEDNQVPVVIPDDKFIKPRQPVNIENIHELSTMLSLGR